MMDLRLDATFSITKVQRIRMKFVRRQFFASAHWNDLLLSRQETVDGPSIKIMHASQNTGEIPKVPVACVCTAQTIYSLNVCAFVDSPIGIHWTNVVGSVHSTICSVTLIQHIVKSNHFCGHSVLYWAESCDSSEHEMALWLSVQCLGWRVHLSETAWCHAIANLWLGLGIIESNRLLTLMIRVEQ